MTSIRFTIATGLLLMAGACAQPLTPLRVAGNMTTIELSPVLVAASGVYKGQLSVTNGGIPNIMNGSADVATNATKQ